MAPHTSYAEDVMTAFAERTGLTGDAEPRRYLWTDAFAVCNYLALHRRTGSARWLDLAKRLVRQVHGVLGRHHPADARTGAISGLDDDAAERHPTAGGLRIGKPLPERAPDEPLDERLEWDRDGQYYHYLTRWLHALDRLAMETGDPAPARWGAELATAMHRGFTHAAGWEPRLYWKVSTDLSRPLVPSMGQHDPLDGLVATAGAAVRQAGSGAHPVDLEREVHELARVCRGRGWATTDALGIGGLLAGGWRLAGLDDAIPGGAAELLPRILTDAARSLELATTGRYLDGPAGQRLAFRELGLSLGLAAVARLREQQAAEGLPGGSACDAALATLNRHLGLRDRIDAFWLEPDHQAVASWVEHEDINAVMLVASLLPEGYLGAA